MAFVFVAMGLAGVRTGMPPHRAVRQAAHMSSVPPEDITVVMNGLPGAMGQEVARACLRRGMALAPMALTGPGMPESTDVEEGDVRATVKLVPGPQSTDVDETALCEETGRALKALADSAGAGRVICIDYTHPSAVLPNIAWYARHGLPFVMGTTGGDAAAMAALLEGADAPARVIAPNMGKQIVAFQAGLAQLAADFPGAFAGYTLRVTESHQKTKADTSGTAKAISASLAALAAADDFTAKSIERVREEAAQVAGAPLQAGGYGRINPVPEESLGGHAFHTYSLVSPDGSVEFQWRHNVKGRRVYAEGTVDAVVFLAGRVSGGDARKAFDMVDVLREGAMT